MVTLESLWKDIFTVTGNVKKAIRTEPMKTPQNAVFFPLKLLYFTLYLDGLSLILTLFNQ